MKPKVFAAFVGPSIVMMLLFIAFPLAAVFWNSFSVTQPIYETVEVESCTAGFLSRTAPRRWKRGPS